MSKPRSIEYGSVGRSGSSTQEQLAASRQKLNVMALALRNMAQALDEQIVLDPESGELVDAGEMYVSMFLDHGRAWQNDNRTYGVFEAWVHFTAGPGAVASTKLDSVEEMEQVEAEGIGRD